MLTKFLFPYLDTLSRFFWQQECLACKIQVFKSELVLCEQCEQTLKDVPADLLTREFERKFLSAGVISGFIPRFLFEAGTPIQELIHSLKYRNKKRAGIYLGKKTGELLRRNNIKADLILPVPLHKSKERERGYNQSDIIAEGITRATGIPWSNKIIFRTRYTESQTNKTLPERRINMANAFSLRNPEVIKKKSIILCDDVITTGATIEEAGKILLAAGAGKVTAVSAAIAE